MSFKLFYRLNYIVATLLIIVPFFDEQFTIPNIYYGIAVFSICFLIAFYLKLLESKELVASSTVANIAIRLIGKIFVIGIISLVFLEFYNTNNVATNSFNLDSPVQRAFGGIYNKIAAALPRIFGNSIIHFFFCLIVGVIAMIPALALSPLILKVHNRRRLN